MIFGVCKVSGHSMVPFLYPNDKILVSSIPYFFTKPKINDVIVFLHNKKRIVKRIKEINNKKLIVMGDNQIDSRDFGLIDKDRILGKLIIKI